ncbi:X2-like carbohydrate binding domain-containing protein [Paenibacillus hamazuiensis]|uniref:X2-like carbohydrate binding domain-containing protein n=1 Tax=Paenibacillus hamazuiensis TaxID=2936508 RepID=UPI00200ED85B|nr:X2-like carbohydrate binding domain-containing protein [Paenibacillus hamazuiensis]
MGAPGKLGSLLAGIAVLGGCLFATDGYAATQAQSAAGVQFFVAQDGSDTNDGSQGSPFATLERARDAVRSLKSGGGLPAGGVTVYLRGGQYRFSSTFQLDERDSGTAESRITYKAYDGEKVTFAGGDTIDPSRFQPVADPAVLARIPQEAGGKVLQLDLKSLGITDYGVLGDNKAVAPELFFNGTVMTLARFPNAGFTTVDEVVKAADSAAGTGYTFTFKDTGLHRWKSIDYTWMLGYWGNDWATNDLQIKSIDFDKKSIETYTGTSYAMKAGQRFYFYNVLEELDSPGEWYLDRNTGLLYLYPPAPVQGKKIQLSLFTGSMISMNNVSNVTFSDIAMEVNRGSAIDINGGENNLVKSCEISKMGGYAVKINGGTNNGVYGCRIYSMGNGGVSLNGGDVVTLTPAGNYADNNDIYNYARIKLTYTSAVELNGVGNRASHNKMHDAPHLAIQFRGNDHLIEYNEIYDVVKETADASAIYSGRSFVWRGNVIRYNYFHDIIASDLRVSTAAIYLDDYMSGVEMRGNVFYKIGKQAFKLANGRENTVENNIVIDTGTSIGFMTRDYKPGEKNYISLMSKFDQVPYQSDIWAQRYPTLPDILNDEPLLPKRNVVRSNAIVNSGAISGDVSRNMELGTFANNATFASKDGLGFNDPAGGNFGLKSDSVLFTQIPGFQNIPFEQIGIQATGLPPANSGLTASYLTRPQNAGDLTVGLKLNGNTLVSVKDETKLLTPGSDYVVQGNTVVLKKQYLDSLDDRRTALAFSFSAGDDAYLVVDTAPPAGSELGTSSLKYALNSGDATIAVNLNGNTLVSVKDGSRVLTEGVDYVNNGSSVTLKKVYLANLPLGTYTLTFTFSAGRDAVLTMTVVRGSLTLGKTYGASSQWSGSYDAAKAFDSNPATRWSAEKGKVTDQYVSVDFGDEVTYNRVVVNESSYPRVDSYVLQYSEDGINYVDIPGTAGTSIGANKEIDFAPVTSRYLRLWMFSTKLEAGTRKEPTINEIEVYDMEDTMEDTIPPVITGAAAEPPNGNNWYNSDVTVRFTASDSGSGIAFVTPDTTLSTEGAGQSVVGTATDKAGNTAAFTVSDINIDKTLPTIVLSTTASYKTTDTLTVTYAVYDDLSGIADSAAVLNGKPVEAGQAIRLNDLAGVGRLEVTTSDKAGNKAVRTAAFEVLIAAAVRVNPDSFNLKRNGGANSVTGYIELSAGYDVSQTELASVRLSAGTASVPAQAEPSEIKDYDGDGIKELMVKFDGQAVANLLANDSGDVTLEVSGSLRDGRKFTGADTIKVLK